MRDPVEKLSSANGNFQNLPANVMSVSEAEDITEAFLLSDNQNVNVNESSSDIAADNFNMPLIK